jgi:hypothetical protein
VLAGTLDLTGIITARIRSPFSGSSFRSSSAHGFPDLGFLETNCVPRTAERKQNSSLDFTLYSALVPLFLAEY